MVTITALGDVMPGGILDNKDVNVLSKGVEDFISDSDIRIATLECAIGDNPTFCPVKSKTSSAFVYARENGLKYIRMLNLDAVSLANNHFFDLGVDGARHTRQLLTDAGVKSFGAGESLKEAQEAVVFERNGETIALLGFCDTKLKHLRIASETSPGINPLTKENVDYCVKRAKEHYDYVVVVVHWGKEHTFWPRGYVVDMAKFIKDTGASLIIGDHPHRVQPLTFISGTPIFYSLGNFLFPNRIINTPYVTYYYDEECKLQNLPKCVGFVRVSRPTLKLWEDISNIGMVAKICLSKSEETLVTYRYSKIDNHGSIDFCKNYESIKRHLNFVSLFLNPLLYPTIYNIFSGVAENGTIFKNRALSFIRRKMHNMFNLIFIVYYEVIDMLNGGGKKQGFLIYCKA